MIKKTTAPGASDAAEKAVPVNVLADPVVVKAEEPAKPKRSRKTKAEAEGAAKPAAKRGRKPAAKTTAEKKTSTRRSTAKKAEGPKKPTALIIMDGFGHRAEKKGNAIEAANKPNLDRIFSENPLTYIGASGLDVGLPDGQMGNSEVGHTNIGAGGVSKRVDRDTGWIERANNPKYPLEYIRAADRLANGKKKLLFPKK